MIIVSDNSKEMSSERFRESARKIFHKMEWDKTDVAEG